MTKRIKSQLNESADKLSESLKDGLSGESTEVILMGPEFDAKLESIADRKSLEIGIASSPRKNELAEAMFDGFVNEFRHLDLIEQLAWFDSKFGGLGDKELIANSKSKNHVHEMCLRMLLDFRRKLTIEFETRKLKNERIAALRKPNISTSSMETSKRGGGKMKSELTIDRAILLLDIVGGHRLKSADREKLAEMLEFLTGFTKESIRQRYSYLNPESEKYKGLSGTGVSSLKKDLKVLDYFCELVGLRGEVQRLSEKLGIPFA